MVSESSLRSLIKRCSFFYNSDQNECEYFDCPPEPFENAESCNNCKQCSSYSPPECNQCQTPNSMGDCQQQDFQDFCDSQQQNQQPDFGSFDQCGGESYDPCCPPNCFSPPPCEPQPCVQCPMTCDPCPGDPFKQYRCSPCEPLGPAPIPCEDPCQPRNCCPPECNPMCSPFNTRRYVQPPRAQSFKPNICYRPPEIPMDDDTIYRKSFECIDARTAAECRMPPVRPRGQLRGNIGDFSRDTVTRVSF